jgi:hypothetical protein
MGNRTQELLMQFENAIQSLCDAGVDFVVVGDIAGVFHGSTEATYAFEVCYSRAPDNLSRLAAALTPFHPRLRGVPAGLPFIWDEQTLRSGTIFTLQTDVGEIDLLAEVAGLGDYAEVKRHSLLVEAFDRSIATLTLPALIRAKLSTGREKDRSAVPELQSLLEAAGQ